MRRQMTTRALLSRIAQVSCMVTGLGLSIGSAAHADERPDVIYGEDDRRDIFDPQNDSRMVEWARSTAMLVRTTQLEENAHGDAFQLPTDTFGQNYNLCDDEPFRNQPNPGFCSGFLVKDDILVTAGHCINAGNCGSTAFVFDMAYGHADHDPTLAPKDNVFYCAEIVVSQYAGGNTTDYAVVRLDRKVEGRTPLTYRKEGVVAEGTDIVVIGHPAGLPTKISAGAAVRDSSNAAYFVANLDTYGGNSGSAVFNVESGVVEGILVRGETDFISRDGCRISNRCEDNGCRGEDVTRSTEFSLFVPGDEDQDPRQTRDVVIARDELDLAIPDNDPAGIDVELDVAEQGEIADIAVAVNLTHSYVGDLEIILIHPDATEVVLYQRQGGSQDRLNEVFGRNGVIVPALRTLKGKDAMGVWKLKIRDLANRDEGTLASVRLTVAVYEEIEEQP